MSSETGKPLRVLFAGTPANAASTLDYLVDHNVDVVGVLTRVDSIVGRSRQTTESPVALAAKKAGLPVHKANRIDAGVIDWVRSLKADLGVVVAYGTIFKSDMLSVPELGWINLHYSLLPLYPGPAPVQQALLMGDESTGVTVFRLDEGVDSGPIVKQELVAIDELDNSSSLLERMTGYGAKLLLDVFSAGPEAITRARAQVATSSVVHAKKPTRQMAKLDFSKSAESQLNKVRAMNPEPMAWFTGLSEPVRVLSARRSPHPTADLSVCRIVGRDLVVSCADESLVLEVVQPAGKKPMSGADWFRGLRLQELRIH